MSPKLAARAKVLGSFPFAQVNVFSNNALGGNPLAVVKCEHEWAQHDMEAVARWTNLSETTFLLPPQDGRADYRLRIFAPSGELPFAGHPTLGSCYAWLSWGGVPKSPDVVVQECGAGLVRVHKTSSRLEFAAPPLLRTGSISDDDLGQICRALELSPLDVLGHQWVDNGPGWCAVLLPSADMVISLKPDIQSLGALRLGVVGAHGPSNVATYEVRAFVGGATGYEDPVTGSLNAGIAQWLHGAGMAKSSYIASQGTCLKRTGQIHLRVDGPTVWVGGSVQTVIEGSFHPHL